MLRSRFISILFEVFKSIRGVNPSYIQKLLSIKKTVYSFRDPSILIQPLTNSTNFGLKTFVYLGSKLWNDLDNDIKVELGALEDINSSNFRSILKRWSGPSDLDTANFYV